MKASRIVATLGIVALVVPLRPAQPTTTPRAEEIYELPKMEVKASMVCSFGIGIVVSLDKKTGAIRRVYVDSVAPGSDAESLGLVRGDEILVINGRKVAELKGGAKAGSELFDLLVNQPPGKKINLEVAVRMVRRVSLTAVVF